MTIPQLSYLATSFWLSVWIPVDYVLPLYHGAIWFLLALFQRVYFVTGGDIGPDPDVFWGFSALSVLVGIVLGVLLQWLVPSPVLLSRRAGWEANVFIKAPVLTALYVGSQLFYARFPPQDDSPWGVILTGLLTSLIVAVTWFWSYSEPWARGNRKQTYIFFAYWIGLNLALVFFFFLGYTSLAEHFVALIAGGGTIALLLLLQLLLPRCYRPAGRDWQWDGTPALSQVLYPVASGKSQAPIVITQE